MFENPRRGREARNFTTNVPKILVLKSSSEQIFSRKLPLGAPDHLKVWRKFAPFPSVINTTNDSRFHSGNFSKGKAILLCGSELRTS